METKAKENGLAVTGGKPAAKEAAFINGNPVNKEGARPQEAKAEETKKEVPQGQTLQPKAEQPKAETRPAKPALNLESTLKLVEELHRRKIQRDKLLDTINTLELLKWHKSKMGTRQMVTIFRAAL